MGSESHGSRVASIYGRKIDFFFVGNVGFLAVDTCFDTQGSKDQKFSLNGGTNIEL